MTNNLFDKLIIIAITLIFSSSIALAEDQLPQAPAADTSEVKPPVPSTLDVEVSTDAYAEPEKRPADANDPLLLSNKVSFEAKKCSPLSNDKPDFPSFSDLGFASGAFSRGHRHAGPC